MLNILHNQRIVHNEFVQFLQVTAFGRPHLVKHQFRQFFLLRIADLLFLPHVRDVTVP